MATTQITASTAAEGAKAQVWTRQAMHEAKEMSCWHYHMGKGPNNICEIREELKKEKGDRIHLNLTENLDVTSTAHRGVGGENTLEGNEVALTFYSDDIAIDQLRQALRTNGKLTEQRAPFDLRMEIKDKLTHWGARTIENIMFNKASGQSYTDKDSNTVFSAGSANTNQFFAGDRTALAELTPADKFNLDMLTDAKTCAEVGYIGATKIYKMRPTMIDGEPHYLAFLHPYAINAVKHSELWRQAVLNARERAKSNPTWTGIVSVWDNVAIKKHDLVFRGSDAGAGSDVEYSTGLLLGAQSMTYAPCQDGFDWIEETFDYGQQWGIATGFVGGFEKIQYNSKDFSTIALIHAAANPRA